MLFKIPYGHDAGRRFLNIKGGLFTENPNGIFDTALVGIKKHSFEVANGNYRLKLYFSERSKNMRDLSREEVVFTSVDPVGERVFTVKANDEMVVERLDIFDRVGRNRPIIISKDVTIKNGILEIIFDPIKGKTTIDAIELRQL